VKEKEKSPKGLGLESSKSPSYARGRLPTYMRDHASDSPSAGDSETIAPPSKQDKPRIHALIQGLFWSSAFILTAAISATLGATLALFTPLSPFIAPLSQGFGTKGELWRQGFQYKVARPVNILVMGIDRVPEAAKNSSDAFDGRTDTLLLLRLDPSDHSIRMLSIPRDTQVNIPKVGIAKINDANVEGGAALTAQVVSSTLNDIPIDRYVRVTTEAFRELVDLVGGIEVFVPYPMKYEDVTQSLYIDLEQGWQTLSGEQAEQFARFRKDKNGDIGRVQRQQTLLKSLRERLVNPSVLPRLPQVIRVMQQYVDTNLSLEELLAIAGFSLKLESKDFKMVLLPGRFSNPEEFIGSYWLIDKAGRDRVMREYFNQNPAWSALDANDSSPSVRIAIQNATSDPRLGRRVARYLAEKNFHNVYIVRDWPEPQRQTQIIAQQGDLEAAATLKKVLGVGTIEASSTGELESDLTIRVGEDWLEQPSLLPQP
jgi:LCP family protein required for cell wall assembly